MAVYFIRSGKTGPVKIGWTKDVKNRLAMLRCASWEPLELIREVDAVRGAEYWLHAHYADRKVHGEWFAFCPTMMEIDPFDAAPAMLTIPSWQEKRDAGVESHLPGKQPLFSPDIWQIIDRCGAELGAKDEARRKWRYRGLPGKWHLPILKKSKELRLGLSADKLMEVSSADLD